MPTVYNPQSLHSNVEHGVEVSQKHRLPLVDVTFLNTVNRHANSHRAGLLDARRRVRWNLLSSCHATLGAADVVQIDKRRQ